MARTCYDHGSLDWLDREHSITFALKNEIMDFIYFFHSLGDLRAPIVFALVAIPTALILFMWNK